jgi:DNA-binding beta-propeller fold protein YncE
VNVWYISFHGGIEHNSRNNIHVYSETGEELGKALNRQSLPDHIELRELRGFGFGPDQNLYVVNAYRKASQILRFSGKPNPDGQHDFLNAFVTHHPEHNPQLLHPFNFAFSPAGHLHVSNQDTSCISRYHGPDTERPGSPMPLPDAIREINEPFPGEFVPSAERWEAGVGVVRDLAIGPDGHLYVADRDSNSVMIYELNTGKRAGVIQSPELSKPIHLTLDPTTHLLVIGNGGNDSVACYDFTAKSCSMLIPPGTAHLNGPAGMAFGEDGDFYVASRLSNRVVRFTKNGAKMVGRPFIKDLADNPEFLLSVSV